MSVYQTFAQRRGRMKGASTKERLSDPKHTARATRMAGRQMRSRLLDAASRLFKERGLAAISIAEIAAAADRLFRARSPIIFAPRKRCSSRRHAVTCSMSRARPSSMPENNSRRQTMPRALVDSVMGSDAVASSSKR